MQSDADCPASKAGRRNIGFIRDYTELAHGAMGRGMD
jgi:hypothetical protein